jgi:hypothetical protein
MVDQYQQLKLTLKGIGVLTAAQSGSAVVQATRDVLATQLSRTLVAMVKCVVLTITEYRGHLQQLRIEHAAQVSGTLLLYSFSFSHTHTTHTHTHTYFPYITSTTTITTATATTTTTHHPQFSQVQMQLAEEEFKAIEEHENHYNDMLDSQYAQM